MKTLSMVISMVLCGVLVIVFQPTPNNESQVRPVEALPLYTSRSGRTCDNCHTNPTDFKNPSWVWRKCTLSCGGCHVNPSGGGLRTVSGRFYGQATLPMLFASHRGYKDWNRHMVKSIGKLEKKRRNRVPDLAAGYTPGSKNWRMSFDQSRYAGLRANPILLFGLDTRMAVWFPGQGKGTRPRFFPMQFDAHLALRPVRHLTLAATGGILARSKGVKETFSDRVFVGFRDLYMMIHELPMNLYLRAGRFLPPFGTNLDDHTSPTRRWFELDGSRLDSRITGVEIGLAPNYPYMQIALFRPSSGLRIPKTDHPSIFGGSGWGVAASAGWRDLGWNIGASVMFKRRKIENGGDMDAYSLQWGINPFFWLGKWFPVTYMGEFSVAKLQREGSSSFGWRMAMFHEIDVLVFNGLNFQLKYDYLDRDLDVKDDHFSRLSFGVDLIVLPGYAIKGQVRVQFEPGEKTQADGLLYFRGWW